MAIYHLSIKIISRGKTKSAVSSAAYRAGEKIVNDYDGEVHDYTRKGGIAHKEILLPENAPSEFVDRATLWNAVERIEKSKNSQLARDIELALPKELSQEENIKLVRAYCQQNFVDTKVDESVLIDTIFAAIKVKLALVEVSEQSYIADRQAKAAEHSAAKKELENKQKKLRLAQASALEDYLEGKIEKSTFQSNKSKTAALIQEAEERLSALGTLSENTSGLVEQHRPFYGQTTLTREMVKELIKEVRVHSPTGLEIVWKFQECYQELEQGFMPNLSI